MIIWWRIQTEKREKRAKREKREKREKGVKREESAESAIILDLAIGGGDASPRELHGHAAGSRYEGGGAVFIFAGFCNPRMQLRASSNPEVRHRAQTGHAADREKEIEREGRRIQSSHNEENTPAPSQGPCVSLCSLWPPGSFLLDLSG